MSINPDQLRQIMRAWTSGVTIVTVSHLGEHHGMTVSSFTSIALDPPLIIISLQTDSRTQKLISQSNAFAVTILADYQQELSDRFAGRIPDAEDRFVGVETEESVSGAPFIKGGLAYLDCQVTQAITTGTNTLFLAKVFFARNSDSGRPLVYFNKGYQQLGG